MSQCTVESLHSSLADLNIRSQSVSPGPNISPAMQRSAEQHSDDRFLFKNRRKDQKKRTNVPRGGGPSMLVYLKDNPRKPKNFHHQHYGYALPGLQMPGAYPPPPPPPNNALAAAAAFDAASSRLPHFYNSLLFPFMPSLPAPPARSRTISSSSHSSMNGMAGHHVISGQQQQQPSQQVPKQVAPTYNKTQQINHTRVPPSLPMTTTAFTPINPTFGLPNPAAFLPSPAGIPHANNYIPASASTVPISSSQQQYITSAHQNTSYKGNTSPISNEGLIKRVQTGSKQHSQYTSGSSNTYQSANSPPWGYRMYPAQSYVCNCDQCREPVSPSFGDKVSRTGHSSSTSSVSSQSSKDSGFSGELKDEEMSPEQKRPYVYCDQNNPTFCLDQNSFSHFFQMAQDPEKYEQKFQEEKRLIRKRIPCRNLSHHGVCHFGEHCWFSH